MMNHGLRPRPPVYPEFRCIFKIRHFWGIGLLLLMGTVLISCSKEEANDGWVQFDLLGQTHTIKERVLMIRANPILGDGDKIKTIQKDQPVFFEFSLGPTFSRSLEESERMGPHGIPEIPQFEALWISKTASDPMDLLRHEISYNTLGDQIDGFVFVGSVSDFYFRSPENRRHTGWLKLDELSEERAKGRFGGTFRVEKLNPSTHEEFEEFIDKEVPITGIFDAPFRKLYQYR